MQIKLQDYTPYSQSLKWQIHNNYFKKKGANAWLQNEVPYDITCNSCAAWQNATLVFEAVKKIESNGALPPDERINVLEMASGVGLFAINFIDRFADICMKNDTNYHERLVYFFTDYSLKNLQDAMQNKFLKDLKEKGKIRYATVNACNPRIITDTDTGKQITGIKFAAAIANYLHCVLPLTIIRKKDNSFFEKNIALYYNLPNDRKIENPQKFAANLINNPVMETVWDNLEERTEYLPIDENSFFTDKDHLEIIRKGVESFDVATIVYPYGSFNAIKNFVPLMKKGGIYVISDKGYSSLDFMYGEKECVPSLHGNSFAHNANFPLMELYAKKLGLAAYRTADPDYGLQTLVVDSGFNEKIKKVFEKIFIEANPNQDAGDFVIASYDYEKNREFEKELTFLKKAIKARPIDARLHLKLGEAYMNLGYYDAALDIFSKGEKYDFFGNCDFDFARGRAYYRLAMDEKALESYNASLNRFGQDSGVYLNIGLCYEMMDNRNQAEQFYFKSLEIDPDYEKAREGLERLRQIAKTGKSNQEATV